MTTHGMGDTGGMRRARLSGVLIGLAVVLLNIAIVVGLVVGLEGTPSLSSSSSSSSPEPSEPSPRSTTEPVPDTPASVIADRSNPVVTVLGADPGVGEGGWVQRLATVTTERSRRVDYAALDPQDPTRYGKMSVTGSGRKLTLRNGSVAGANLTYATNRAQFLVPKNADVVLLSFAPSNGSGLASDLNALRRAVRKQAPDAALGLVLPPRPADGSGGSVRKAAQAWARKMQVRVIDVDAAFRKSTSPDLRADWLPTGLSESGADLWAQTVADALLGSGSRPSPSEPPVEQPPPTLEEVVPTTEETTNEVVPEPEPVVPGPQYTPSPTYVPPPVQQPDPPADPEDPPPTSESTTDPLPSDPSESPTSDETPPTGDTTS